MENQKIIQDVNTDIALAKNRLNRANNELNRAEGKVKSFKEELESVKAELIDERNQLRLDIVLMKSLQAAKTTTATRRRHR